MSEENAPQKERYLREVEQKLLHRELDARLLEEGLVHVSWNEKPLCSVDRDGIVRFRPVDITGPASQFAPADAHLLAYALEGVAFAGIEIVILVEDVDRVQQSFGVYRLASMRWFLRLSWV